MKTKQLILMFLGFLFSVNMFGQDIGTGMTWGETFTPYEQLLINENFMGFDFYFNGQNINDGNSKNEIDPVSGEMIYGYKDDSLDIHIPGSESGTIRYIYKQCAFAPEWKTVRAEFTGGENTENVSDGFVEISRPDTKYSTVPTLKGHFIVDLREVSFVEGMYWSHSSTGNGKRGAMCEISVDDGITWDTLRYQPGENSYAKSFHKDISTGEKTYNLFRCDQAAFGMTWEDEIYAENVMLRFVCAGETTIQTLRLHDLKIYGLYVPPTFAETVKGKNLEIIQLKQRIKISELSNVEIYDLTGKVLYREQNTKEIPLDIIPKGTYIVRASNGKLAATQKIVNQF